MAVIQGRTKYDNINKMDIMKVKIKRKLRMNSMVVSGTGVLNVTLGRHTYDDGGSVCT